ncbi:MAG: hypothetical protein KJ939_03845 [Nanoarchaeota archaeon]|nr:hypothetical protein [Nanoarchaeota archaeon]
MKLKTLKDIKGQEFPVYENTGNKAINTTDCNISSNVLRQEAIKWIKKLRKDKELILNLIKEDKVNDRIVNNFSALVQIDAQIRWIKHFFSIDNRD